MWRVIIRSCECQFYGQMQTEIQCHFGVLLSTMCDHLQQHFQIDDLDDTMSESVLTDALDPADRYGLCDSTE